MIKILPRAASPCALALTVVGLTLSSACKPHAASVGESRMGEPAVAGRLTFNVVEARWRSQLDAFPTPRMPGRNFLMLKLTVTNGGGQPVALPYLKVENSSGEIFSEVENGAGVDNWFGMFRRIQPAQTEEGWLLFDVPTNSYKLRVTNGAVEDEQVAYISIPLNMQTDAPPPRMP
jgi:hypothetical protein